MSEYYEETEYEYEEDNCSLSESDLLEIQEEYRHRRLIESLIGPVISTVFHIGLIIILAILITDKYKQEAPEIIVTVSEEEEVQIEEPPPLEEPEPIEEPQDDVVNPVLTTVALENVDTNDAALEDVNDEAPSTDDDSTVEAVSDVTVSPSAFASPNVFGGRSAAGRASAVSKFGGTKVGQQSLMKALWWLAKVQNPDGSWGEGNYGQAMTGLALLTFLAHGETQTSKNFGKTVRMGMEWLASSPTNTKTYHAYPHAIKAYALSEAYAMTGVSMLEEAMNKSMRVIIDGQQKSGCFDYLYKQSTREDLSLAGWNYQALKAAYGAGCSEEGLQDAIYKSIDWLKKRAASSATGKGFPYKIQDGIPSAAGRPTMRAVGVLCLQLFGEGKTPELADEIQAIAEVDYLKLNWNNPPSGSLYGWYYATQAMFQQGGNEWKTWNRKFQKELNDNQHPEGYWEWPGNLSRPARESLTGKIYATTLCALMLTVYYRYLPSSKGAIGNKNAKKEKAPILEEEEGLNLIE